MEVTLAMATLGNAAEFDKECVRRALAGELYAGEDDLGPVFVPAEKASCDRFVLEMFDKWYYQAKQLADTGRALESVMERHGWQISFDEYMRARAEAGRQYNTYLFEHDRDILAEELGWLEDGAAGRPNG